MSISTQKNPKEQYSQKRTQFYNQIKQRSKQSIFSAIRLKYLKLESSEILHRIIIQTQTSITTQQLTMMINLALKGNYDAIIHIGNLIIQGIIGEEIILYGNQILQFDANCGYFQWLLLAMLSRKIYDQTLMCYVKMLQSINKSKTKDQFRKLNCLKCLTHLLKISHPNITNSLFITNFHNLRIDNLLKNTLSTNLQISKQSYRLANNLFNQQNDQNSIKLIKLLKINQFYSILKNGLMSTNHTIRLLMYQMFTNNIACLIKFMLCQQQYAIKQQFVRLLWQSFNLVNTDKQKNSIKVEISYLMVNYIQSVSFIQVVESVGKGFVKVVNQLYLSNKNIQNQQINANCKQIYKYLLNLRNHYQCQNQKEKYQLQRIYYQLTIKELLQHSMQIQQQL